LTYYRDVSKLPIAKMLQEAGHTTVDPCFIWFCDSSFGDCDAARSTGCHVGLLQGGLINFSSFVPNPIAASSCESETNTMTVAAMASRQTAMIYCDLVYGDQDRPFTVPMFTDSLSGMAATRNQRTTSMSRHIARRWYYIRQARQTGHIQLLHIDGDKYQLADLGTKNVPASEATYKLSLIESPVIEEGLIVAQTREAPAEAVPMAKLKRGVGNPNGVPEVSHVVSNVAETDAVSKERFSRSSTVSFALDLSIGGVSTVHNHRSSTVQFPIESCTLGLNSQALGS